MVRWDTWKLPPANDGSWPTRATHPPALMDRLATDIGHTVTKSRRWLRQRLTERRSPSSKRTLANSHRGNLRNCPPEGRPTGSPQSGVFCRLRGRRPTKLLIQLSSAVNLPIHLGAWTACRSAGQRLSEVSSTGPEDVFPEDKGLKRGIAGCLVSRFPQRPIDERGTALGKDLLELLRAIDLTQFHLGVAGEVEVHQSQSDFGHTSVSAERRAVGSRDTSAESQGLALCASTQAGWSLRRGPHHGAAAITGLVLPSSRFRT